MKRCFLFILALAVVSFTAFAALGQDIQTKGGIRGTVTDPNGAVVAGASVTVTGPAGERMTTTDSNGSYEVTNLNPGVYTVKISQSGFKSVSVNNQTVFVGKVVTIDTKLELGESSVTVDVTAGADIDQSSTAVGSNLNDQLFQNIPVARGVAGLFYLAPGTSDGLGGGRDNPSISGGSALDNLYVADGVNITNSAFGGIGTFSRSYGALGTGINTSFVKEVQIKTGGFEPQYGQTTGGIINIITQSGTNKYSGAIYGYARPNAFEATYRQRDDFSVNKVGKLLASENFDAGADFGGPIIRDRLFFFGSFNPTIRRDVVLGASNSGLFTQIGEHNQRYRTYNYAAKVDWNVNSNHTFSFSLFGDPTKTNKSSFSSLNIDNATAFSVLDFGSRNMSLRYNGTLSSSWTLSSSFGMNKNHFDEAGFDDLNLISDATGPQAGGSRGSFTAVGRGFIEPTEGKTFSYDINTMKTVNFWGQHNFGLGYQFQRGNYSGLRDRSGPHFTIPSMNADGISLAERYPASAPAIGQTVNTQWSLRIASNSDPGLCRFCPVFNVPGASDIGLGPGNRRVYLLQTRGEYGVPSFDTYSDYNAGYVQDTWRINRYITALAGLRMEQEKVAGSRSLAGTRAKFSFTDQWAPRLGITIDPTGKGKMKAYYNYGRFFEYLPLDLAERSLSAEQDFINTRVAPEFTTCATPISAADRCAVINEFGTVNPTFDASHILNGVVSQTDGSNNGFPSSGISVGANDPSNPILAGTKLGFLDEHVIGFETQLPHKWTLGVRYLDRNLKRVVEDAAVISPEQYIAGLFGQGYFLGNVSSTLDAAVNPIPHLFTPGATPPAECGGENAPYVIDPVTDPRNDEVVLGAICYEPDPNAGNLGSDGIPDGFPDVAHRYRAVEIELNRRFADNWQVLSNWRIARLRGNYEGHLRNDNGQTDPGISSLFDFTSGEFNLLGDQFASGPLNSDRRHVINVYGNYSFSKGHSGAFGDSFSGLNLGVGFHAESGLPISELFAHPAYQNAGEIPVGGRGKLGRTPWNARLDLHADYPWNFSERTRLKFIADFFNVTNTRRVRQFLETRETQLGVPNVDFLQPRSFYSPFNMRLGVRLEF